MPGRMLGHFDKTKIVPGELQMHLNAIYPVGARQRSVRFEEPGYERERIAQGLGDLPDLEAAFSHIRREVSVGSQMSFRLVAEGQPERLRPEIRDEVYWIGREALVNAFRHSHGSLVELELAYAPKGLCLVVCDNGKGMPSELSYAGRDYHRGLCAMRARAEQIGAKLTLSSRVGVGTEVDLTIPDHIAFLSRTGARRFRWLHI
jgi:signal transduction histidine kinase